MVIGIGGNIVTFQGNQYSTNNQCWFSCIAPSSLLLLFLMIIQTIMVWACENTKENNDVESIGRRRQSQSRHT